MKKILIATVITLISTSTFAADPLVPSYSKVFSSNVGSQTIDTSGSTAYVGTGASGSITQGNGDQFIYSGAQVTTSANAGLYGGTNAAAGGTSLTTGSAWGNGTAGYAGFSTAQATKAIGSWDITQTVIEKKTIVEAP